MKLYPSHPLYEKIEILNLLLSCAVNRWPFSPYQHMPELELSIEIDSIKQLIQDEMDSFVNTKAMVN